MLDAEKIADARAAKGMSQEDLAKAAGVSQAAIAKIEKGRVLRSRATPEIARALGLAIADIDPGFLGVSEVEFIKELPKSQLGERDMPMMGVTAGGSDGEFYMNGEVVDYVRRPPGLKNNKAAYTVGIVSDSMIPRYEPGEIVYVNPLRAPNIGDFVVVELIPQEGERNGPSFIKRLVRRSGTRVICEQYNPAGEIEYDTREVKTFHRIMPWQEVLGL